MELGFGGVKLARLTRRDRRMTRAQWWFAHMRQIVDHAMDWQAAPEPRPEQTWLPGTQRQVQVSACGIESSQAGFMSRAFIPQAEPNGSEAAYPSRRKVQVTCGK